MNRPDTLALSARDPDRILYHQIHPLKLATDWTTGVLALYLLWRRRVALALAVAILPALLVSWALLRFASLEPQRDSAFGRYVRRYMTPGMQGLRLAGYAIAAAGASLHRAWLIPAGLAVVLGAWLRGVLFPMR